MMKTNNKPKHVTRWQLRVNPDLEEYVRELARIYHRSINQTLIVIIEAHRRDYGTKSSYLNNPKEQ